MAYTEQQLKDAARKALAAGDQGAAKRLIDAARAAAKQAPQASPQPPVVEVSPATPALSGGFEMGTGQPMRSGPGPTGQIDPALYDMGAIGRRMQPGTPIAPSTVDSTMADMGGAFAAGIGRGAAGLADLPGDLTEMSIGAAEGLLGRPVPELLKRGIMAAVPGGTAMNRAINPDASVRQGLSDMTGGGSEYIGNTTAGQYAGTIGEFIPGAAAFGGASPANLIRNAVLPGIGSEMAGQATKGTDLDAVARFGGALIGAAAPSVVDFGTKAFKSAFRMSAERPSLESLRTAKTVAYKAVDDAGEVFQPNELQGMVANVKSTLDDLNYLPEADTTTAAILKRLDDINTRPLSLGQLDKMRQVVWARYNSSKEPGLLEVIDGIDELVANRATTNELLGAARLANGRYKKAELLDLAFQKATDQTASTGSGGNILNKYRQAVTSIINNPKQAKWFTAEEIAVMREFVRGTPSQNAMRLIGKLSPSGNGLMTALNLGAAGTFGAPALALSAGASAAKAVADGATERAAQRLIGRVAGQPQAPKAGADLPTIWPFIAGTNAISDYGR